VQVGQLSVQQQRRSSILKATIDDREIQELVVKLEQMVREACYLLILYSVCMHKAQMRMMHACCPCS
jgi:hypothetical protein